jgi:O-antigen/teichoic acid export membrane protein
LGVQVCLSIAAIVVIGSLSVAFGSTGHGFAAPTRIFSLSLLPSACFSVASAMLRGLGLLRAYAGLVIAAAAAPLAAVAGFVRRGDSVERTMTVLLAAQVASAVVAVACCAKPLRAARPSLRVRRSDIWTMARSSGAVGAAGLVGVLYQRLAMLGVSLLVGPAATGWYAGSARIVEGSKVGHVAIATATYPVMARGRVAREDGAPDMGSYRMVQRSWAACLVLGAAVTVTLLVVGPALVSLLYGDGFADSRRGVIVLALGVVPSTVATFRTLSLLAEHREREVLWAMALGVAVLAVVSFALVPAFGWIGACWAMTIADTSQAVVLTVLQRRGTTVSRLEASL